MSECPDKIVAEKIKERFETDKILKDDDLNKLIYKLSEGNISDEDWKLMAELSLEKRDGDGNTEKD